VAEILLLCGNYLIKDVDCCLQDDALIEPRAKAEIWTERDYSGSLAYDFERLLW
jgi:hypothetical protein